MHLVTKYGNTKLWEEVSGKRLIGLEAQYRLLAVTLHWGPKFLGSLQCTAANFTSEMVVFIRAWPSYLFSFQLELKLNFKNDNHALVGPKTFWSLVYKSVFIDVWTRAYIVTSIPSTNFVCKKVGRGEKRNLKHQSIFRCLFHLFALYSNHLHMYTCKLKEDYHGKPPIGIQA